MTARSSTTSSVLRTAGALLALAAPAAAQSINIDIGPGVPFGRPLGTWGGVPAQPGHWNQVSGTAAGYVGAIGGPLQNTGGGLTIAQIRLSAGADFFCNFANGCVGVGPAAGNDAALLNDLSRFTNACDVSIKDLLPGFYSVYVYAWAPDNANAITVVEGVNVGGAWTGMQLSGRTYMSLGMVAVTQNVPLKIKLRGAIGSLNGIQLVQFGTPVGTNFCQPNANSTGLAATMTSFGSNTTSNNELFLGTTGMPNNSFGFYITSTTADFVALAGGSSGNLCLGGAIGRGVGGQIYNSGNSGSFSTIVNLFAIPTPTGSVPVMPGDTWLFQTWYRDAVGGTTTSNFSDGHSITFQ